MATEMCGVEPRGGRRDGIDGDLGVVSEAVLLPVGRGPLLDAVEALVNVLGRRIVLHAQQQLGIGRAKVRPGADRGVVAVPGGRRAGMEVLGLGEGLADQAGPDDVTVRVLDQRAVGLVVERHLGDAGDDQREDEPRDDREDDHHHQRGKQLATHHDTPRFEMIRSMSLMPTKGATMPPSP